jgi:hypothetical protein
MLAPFKELRGGGLIKGSPGLVLRKKVDDPLSPLR